METLKKYVKYSLTPENAKMAVDDLPGDDIAFLCALVRLKEKYNIAIGEIEEDPPQNTIYLVPYNEEQPVNLELEFTPIFKDGEMYLLAKI